MKATGLYQVFFATIVFGLNGYFIANVCGNEGTYADLPLHYNINNNNHHYNITHTHLGRSTPILYKFSLLFTFHRFFNTFAARINTNTSKAYNHKKRKFNYTINNTRAFWCNELAKWNASIIFYNANEIAQILQTHSIPNINSDVMLDIPHSKVD